MITLEGSWIALPLVLGALHVVGLALLVAVVVARGRHRGRRLLVASGVATVSCIVLAYVTALRPHDVPNDWVTVLTRVRSNRPSRTCTSGACTRGRLPWTLVFALNPALFQAAFSELPTHLLAAYFMAGVVAWAVVRDALPQPSAVRIGASILCGIRSAGATRRASSL